MIKGIIFDCFGVLYGGSLEYLVSLAPKERHTDVYDINSQKDYGFISYAEYLQQMGDIIGRPPQEIDDIVHKKHVRNEELIAYVASLRSEYKIGLLSNIGDTMIEGLFTKEELDRLFDDVLLSHNVGLAKPNPAIFTLATERLGLSPGECIMIDDIESNCDGAEIAGMYSVRHISNELTREAVQKIVAQKA